MPLFREILLQNASFHINFRENAELSSLQIDQCLDRFRPEFCIYMV